MVSWSCCKDSIADIGVVRLGGKFKVLI
jgi:hypothetical protein